MDSIRYVYVPPMRTSEIDNFPKFGGFKDSPMSKTDRGRFRDGLGGEPLKWSLATPSYKNGDVR